MPRFRACAVVVLAMIGSLNARAADPHSRVLSHEEDDPAGMKLFERPEPVTFRWTSVAGFTLDDGETTLAFDPVFSRPGLLQWLGLKEFAPDEAAIAENLRYLGLKKLDAIFVSHEHFDHAVDAAFIAHRTGATVYGGPSLERIVRANELRYGWSVGWRSVADREWIQVGKFRLKFFRREHGPIFRALDFHFLKGAVPENFRFGFYQYEDGDVWCWLIEHPRARVYVDQGAQFFEGAAADLGPQVDNMLLGVANKISVDDYVSRFIARFHPKLAIPLHFDFFWTAPDREHTKMLPGIDYDEIVAESARVSPKTEWKFPKFGESIPLVEPEARR